MPAATTAWSAAARAPAPAPGEVHVWRVPVPGEGAALDRLGALLDADERRRAAAIRVPAARRRFVAAHGTLRALLAEALGGDPRALRFASGHGKPRLDPASDADFSISHSGGLVLIALARGARVGVDVERLRERTDVLGVAARVLGDPARATLAALPPAERRAAFFALWTRAEAYGKARGTGLTGVRDDPPGPGWWVRELDAGPGYAAAVAADRPLALRCWERSAPAPGPAGLAAPR
jgi:4'-phosphopantetheinyl transferase